MTPNEAYEILRDDEAGKSWEELGYSSRKEFNVAYDEAFGMALDMLKEGNEAKLDAEIAYQQGWADGYAVGIGGDDE